MQIVNAIQLKNGAVVKDDVKGFNSFTQPLQFLSHTEKDDDWAMHNMDWLEWQGIQQIRQNARKLMKNYKLAEGVIDRSDYMAVEDCAPDDLDELVNILSMDSIQDEYEDDSMDLKFYPIIPNVINVLVAEFAKRNTAITFRTEGEHSYNEIMTAKMGELEEALLADASSRLTKQMIEMGMDPESPEAQEQLSPDLMKRLPEIEGFYSKTYQTIGEEWAQKQHGIDVKRFHMDEMEEIAFRDSLITDREFWHFNMYEDDYGIELWNPALTFYHKSPSIDYISKGNWVGKIDMFTVSDVLEMLGPMLNQEQQESLEGLHPIRAGRLLMDDLPNDGSYYNPQASHADNMDPSLQMKRWLTHQEHSYDADDIVSWIIGQSEGNGILRDDQMLRVTTAYWKTQRKVGYLTSVLEHGEVKMSIVDETYVVANNPIYHSNVSSQRNAQTLIAGDHIDWIWINQVIGARKIGPNRGTFTDYQDRDEFSPIYIGIEGNKIGPIRYQFKGDDSLYGCKLPVEGKIFTERNTKSTALVDLMKPAQIGHNMVCNQLVDIIIDEIGSVVALDQNALPQHAMDESWGKGNYAKAYGAMKEFGILPLDTSLANTENALNFNHYQMLNLEQGSRIRTRVELAHFFKQQGLDVIGFTPERLGQQIGQTQTATGTEQAVAGSYAQTEMYFIQHSDHLMPRVHQMRTDLAQYYHSQRDSIKLQSMISPDERKFFEINGVDLLMLDIHVYATTNANDRHMLEQMKAIAGKNNTAGASLLDIENVLESKSMGTLNNALREMEAKAEERAKLEHARAKELAQAESEARQKEIAMENDHDAKIQESKNRANVLIAEIRAAGFGATQDLDQNMQSDFVDAMDKIKEDQNYQSIFNFDKTKEDNKNRLGSRKLDIEEKKIDTAKEIADNQLKVARENTSASEIKAKREANSNKKSTKK